MRITERCLGRRITAADLWVQSQFTFAGLSAGMRDISISLERAKRPDSVELACSLVWLSEAAGGELGHLQHPVF